MFSWLKNDECCLGVSHRMCRPTIGIPTIFLSVIWQSYRVNNLLAVLLICTVDYTILIIIVEFMVCMMGGKGGGMYTKQHWPKLRKISDTDACRLLAKFMFRSLVIACEYIYWMAVPFYFLNHSCIIFTHNIQLHQFHQFFERINILYKFTFISVGIRPCWANAKFIHISLYWLLIIRRLGSTFKSRAAATCFFAWLVFIKAVKSISNSCYKIYRPTGMNVIKIM